MKTHKTRTTFGYLLPGRERIVCHVCHALRRMREVPRTRTGGSVEMAKAAPVPVCCRGVFALYNNTQLTEARRKVKQLGTSLSLSSADSPKMARGSAG